MLPWAVRVDHRQGSDPELLWLWHRPAAVALIRPLVSLGYYSSCSRCSFSLVTTLHLLLCVTFSCDFCHTFTPIPVLHILLLRSPESSTSEFYLMLRSFLSFFLSFFNLTFFFFLVFCRAAPVAYGGSQAMGRIGIVATSLIPHLMTGSKPCLRPTP